MATAAPTSAQRAETGRRWVRFASTRDPSLREQLILQYTPLVKYVVGRLAITLPRVLESDDILSCGTVGLIDAVDRFDPSTGVKFETYAISRIRGTILDELRSLDWIPRSARQRAQEIARTFARLEGELGRAPTDEEVAGELGMDMVQYTRASLSASAVVLSLETPTRTGDAQEGTLATTLVDTIEDPVAPDPLSRTEEGELLDRLSHSLRRLSERERILLSLYYEQELTMREISLVLEVSESRVCQLHARALLRLRGHMADLHT
ncbi:MAG: hypothetical protein CL878_06755 [Dehalococcoidia bacterium]|nr:hypothetical protein [Dehalococcoidia bacterium]